MGIYRWIGSGNTASTSVNIFNWNHPGNWEVATYIGPGASAGYQFRGTAMCPGAGDDAIFGHVTPAFNNINPNVPLTKVKSPCLFGGFVGNAGGGTWTNASVVYGTTYTSSLFQVVVNQTNNHAYMISQETTVEGYTAYAGSYNDTAYAFQGTLPLGGGITGNPQCFENLKWIQANYPHMGVAADLTGGYYAYTIPASYTSTWDNLNVKTSSLYVLNIGSSGSSRINMNFTTAYAPLSGICGAGFTGVNAPVCITTAILSTSSDVYLSGGAFKVLSVYPGFKRNSADPFGRFPDVVLDNMFVETLTVPEICDTTVGSGVRFITLNTTPQMYPWFSTNTGNIYNAFNRHGFNPRIIRVNGSGSVTQVNAVLYPGNSANTSGLKSTIQYGTNELNLFGVPGGVSLSTATMDTYKWSLNSSSLENYYGNPAALDYRVMLSGEEFDAAQYWGQEHGTLKMILGTSGVTNDVERVEVKSVGACTKIVQIQGPININELKVGRASYVKFDGHNGTSNIGLVNLHPMSTLNLHNAWNDGSIINFGIKTATGVCGGIQLQTDQADTSLETNVTKGRICLEVGERLFNVNTLKGGAIQVPAVGESSFADVAAPAVARKG